jgi:hypothetical protein
MKYTLRVEEEKGFTRTAKGSELAGPKRRGKPLSRKTEK